MGPAGFTCNQHQKTAGDVRGLRDTHDNDIGPLAVHVPRLLHRPHSVLLCRAPIAARCMKRKKVLRWFFFLFLLLQGSASLVGTAQAQYVGRDAVVLDEPTTTGSRAAPTSQANASIALPGSLVPLNPQRLVRASLIAMEPSMVPSSSHVMRRLTVIIVQPGNGTLQAEHDRASAGDELVLADGVYTGSGTNVLHIQKSITIRAQNAGQAVLDGENARCVVLISAGPAVLDGLHITRGTQVGGVVMASEMAHGGGVVVGGGEVTLRSSHIYNNQAYMVTFPPFEHPIAPMGCSLSIQFGRCSQGGGVTIYGQYHTSPPELTVDNCDISGNQAVGVGRNATKRHPVAPIYGKPC